MKTHIDRLKRGALALLELLTIALAAGAALGTLYGAFLMAYTVIGWAVMAAVFTIAFIVYMLGIADQRDEAAHNPKPEQKKD